MTHGTAHEYYTEVATDELPTLLFRSGTERDTVHMSAHAAEDLGIEDTATRFQSKGIGIREAYEILAHPVVDAETIGYRQEVFKDFRGNTALREAFRDLLPRFDELANFTAARREAGSPLQETIWRLGELELLVECVEKLHSALEREPAPRSEALRRMRDYLQRMRQRHDYRSMREQLPKLRGGLQHRKSITIGINLDEKLRPVEVAMLDIHDKPFVEKSLAGRLFGANSEFRVSSAVLTSPIPPELSAQTRGRIPLAPLFRELDKLLGSTLRPIQRALRAYLKENTELFQGLRKEAAFFLGAVELADELEDMGLPICLPDIAPSVQVTDTAVQGTAKAVQGSRTTGQSPASSSSPEHIEALYNLHLPLRADHHKPGGAGKRQGGASNRQGRTAADGTTVQGTAGAARDAAGAVPNTAEVVLNDIHFREGHDFFVLTGPNQGGKTTFTQAVGIAHIFAQSGIFMPAARATIAPVDVIDTHFPTAEYGSLETGRLSEEARRLSEIVDSISPRSLVLLNESFASTSPHEAVALASELLQIIAKVGVRGIFATHLHELAMRTEEYGHGIAPLTAEAVVHDGSAQRTYRIREGAPEGNSFARDIAVTHGLSYEQMKRRLESRGIEIDKNCIED